MEVVLVILFFIFSNADIWFVKKKLKKKRYLTVKALPTIKSVKLIDKKEFAAMTFDKNTEIFVIHVIALLVLPI